MAYNFDEIIERRNTLSAKWTEYPKDVLALRLADMDFRVAPQIRSALQKQLDHGVFGYEEPKRPFMEIIASRMKNLYNWDVKPEWILFTPGVNTGFNAAARFLCTSKQGYLVQTPVYNEFHDISRKVGVPQRTVRLEKKISGNRISYEVDLDAFEREVKRSGMFLLCYPHNPVGKIYSRNELMQMAEICLRHDVPIVSDEIHSEVLLGGSKFLPLAKLLPAIKKRSITLISASKAFNVPGLVCAFAIIPDETLRNKFEEVVMGMSFEIPTPGLAAAQVAYEGRADVWLRALRRYLTANRDFIIDYVTRNLPGVRMTRPDATYLMWLDFSELKLKQSPYAFFLDKAKVALGDGGKFGKGNEQFVRLNFGTSQKLLMNALERMNKALK